MRTHSLVGLLFLSLAALPLAAQRRASLQGAPHGATSADAALDPLRNRVRGRVWLDLDHDGLQSAGEPGVAGAVVHLLDGYGRRVDGATATTDPAGEYALAGMPAGEYRIGFERPAGRRFTRTDVGGRDLLGAAVSADSRPDDSDLNLENGYLDPSRRGPRETGMRYVELTRLDAQGAPWPVNAWVVYPAAAGSNALPRARVRDLYLDDYVDIANTVATSRLATTITGGAPADVEAADPESLLQDVEARVDAPLSADGPFPVMVFVSGLIGSSADMVEIGDQLASHGYVALCLESAAFHASIALGDRLSVNGGPWEQADFAHIPQVSGPSLTTLLGFGYQVAGYITGNINGSVTTQSRTLAADVPFALDAATVWNQTGGHFFEGALDLEQVGWYGYSRGAGASRQAVTGDERIAFLINADSSTFVNVPKPMLWVGNHVFAATEGPSVMARLSNDFHPHYFFVPAIRFDPPDSGTSPHREYHHQFRNDLITAFCGLWLKGVQGHRADLGLDGVVPTFDGYVTPYLQSNFAGWHTEAFALVGGTTKELDAGLVSVPLWLLDGDLLSSLDTTFLAAGSLAGASKTDHGAILVESGCGLEPLEGATTGLAIDADGRGWFLAGSPPALYELDTRAVAGGAPPVARALGVVSGLPSTVVSLAFDARGSALLAVDAGPTPALHRFVPEPAPTAAAMGVLPASVVAPAGLALGARGRLWIADAAGERLARLSPGTCQALDELALAGAQPGSLAYDAVSALLFEIDGVTGELVAVDTELGVSTSLGSLLALGFAGVPAAAFEARRPSGGAPSVLGADVAPGVGAGPRPVLEDVFVQAPAGGWSGALLRAQVAEGSGLPADRLSLAAAGSVALGARVEIDLPALQIGEATEVLWEGQHVGWLETDWDLAIGGVKLAPVRVAFTERASAAAVAAVVAALRYEGALPRRIEVSLADAEGRAGLAEVVELDE